MFTAGKGMIKQSPYGELKSNFIIQLQNPKRKSKETFHLVKKTLNQMKRLNSIWFLYFFFFGDFLHVHVLLGETL